MSDRPVERDADTLSLDLGRGALKSSRELELVDGPEDEPWRRIALPARERRRIVARVGLGPRGNLGDDRAASDRHEADRHDPMRDCAEGDHAVTAW